MNIYPKFKNNEECAFPERKDCNYGKGYERCIYMKCDDTKIPNSKWICIYPQWKCPIEKLHYIQEYLKIREENRDSCLSKCCNCIKNGRTKI